MIFESKVKVKASPIKCFLSLANVHYQSKALLEGAHLNDVIIYVISKIKSEVNNQYIFQLEQGVMMTLVWCFLQLVHYRSLQKIMTP